MAPFNRYQTIDVIRAVLDAGRENEIALYTGNDDNILIDLLTEFNFGDNSARIVGGLLGHWAVWTKTAVAHLELAKQSRGPIAADHLTLAQQITDANAAFFDAANTFAGCIAGIHEVLRRQGLLDGGRDRWISEGRALTTEPAGRPATDYPVVDRDDSVLRAYKEDVLVHLGKPLIDVRSAEEYTGERTSAPAYPEEGALRAGHIPTASSVPWARAVAEDGGFKTRAELEAIYRDEVGLKDGDEVVAYCRIGERSAHTWFVLKHLLGFENVRNYDGSWTEWGSAVRVPIVTGAEPGEAPLR